PLGTLAWVIGAMLPALALHFVPGLPDVLDVALGLAVYGGILIVAGRAPRELLDPIRREPRGRCRPAPRSPAGAAAAPPRPRPSTAPRAIGGAKRAGCCSRR